MTIRKPLSLILALPLLALAGCSDYRDDTREPAQRDAQANNSSDVFPNDSAGVINRFKQKDPTLSKFFDNAYAYVVLPKVAKGAAGIGAANGDGDAFEMNKRVGYVEMTQVTVGFQLGGQTYSELIFFKDKPAFDNFRGGNFEFSANASAVAAESGRAAANDYSGGIAVFTMPRGGLMFEASIGGQKFKYRPM